MSTSSSIERLRQALRPIDDGGMPHGGPDGWRPEPDEINEWEETFREVANPTTIRALLDELDALRETVRQADSVLRVIAEQDPVKNCLDPQWAARIAKSARAALNTKEAKRHEEDPDKDLTAYERWHGI